MKKRIFTLCLALMLVFSFSIPALAATSPGNGNDTPTIAPRAAMNVSCGLSIYSGSQVKGLVNVIGTKAGTITIMAYLQRWNGSGWVTYESWYKSGYGTTLSLSMLSSPPLGYQYRVMAVCSSASVSGTGYSQTLYWY